jgi:hypothetical protein
MNFQKQVQFSKLIKANGRLREFNFLKLNNTELPSYRVDVSDEKGRRYIFQLTNNGGECRISGEDLPKWIIDTETALQEAIPENSNGL